MAARLARARWRAAAHLRVSVQVVGAHVAELTLDEDAGAATTALMDLCYSREAMPAASAGALPVGPRLGRADATTVSAKRVRGAACSVQRSRDDDNSMCVRARARACRRAAQVAKALEWQPQKTARVLDTAARRASFIRFVSARARCLGGVTRRAGRRGEQAWRARVHHRCAGCSACGAIGVDGFDAYGVAAPTPGAERPLPCVIFVMWLWQAMFGPLHRRVVRLLLDKHYLDETMVRTAAAWPPGGTARWCVRASAALRRRWRKWR